MAYFPLQVVVLARLRLVADESCSTDCTGRLMLCKCVLHTKLLQLCELTLCANKGHLFFLIQCAESMTLACGDVPVDSSSSP